MTTFLTDHAEIQAGLDQYCDTTGTVTISSEGCVSVKGDVTLKPYTEISHFAVQFDTVEGDFCCSDCSVLTSLHGTPRHVSGEYRSNRCEKLTSLEGSPAYVGGDFSCDGCVNLITLEGAPEYIGGSLDCTYCSNNLNLDGIKVITDALCCSELPNTKVDAILNLIKYRVCVITRNCDWVDIVNTYHKSGDLLAAMAHVEALFHLDYTPEPPADVPTLNLTDCQL